MHGSGGACVQYGTKYNHTAVFGDSVRTHPIQAAREVAMCFFVPMVGGGQGRLTFNL
jgi:hypothetical protein